MGQEQRCEARYGGKVSPGKALLETDDLIFRGDFRVSVPLKSIESIESADGVLTVGTGGGKLQLVLGDCAARWADKIRNPPTLAGKLGIKPGLRISLLGVAIDMEGQPVEISEGKAAKESDLIFYAAEREKDVAKLASLTKSLKPKGAIWVVYPKGRKEITEVGVIRAGRAAGLTDIKVARFSATHTALKLVVPVAKR